MAGPQRTGNPEFAVATPPANDSTRFSATQLAEAIAQAICTVPGVAALSAGQFSTAATYGRGQTVRGVVIHWADGAVTAVDVHVVVHAPDLAPLPPALRADRGTASQETPVLAVLADAIRGRVADVLCDLGIASAGLVDVYLDDLT